MKKSLIFILLFGAFTFLSAQSYRMQVVEKSSNVREFELGGIRSVMFPDSVLQLNFKTGTQEKITKSTVRKIVFYIPSSTVELSGNELKLFPDANPDFIHVLSNENAAFAVYSVLGKVCTIGQLISGDNLLNVSILTPGIYIFKSQNNSLKFVKK